MAEVVVIETRAERVAMWGQMAAICWRERRRSLEVRCLLSLVAAAWEGDRVIRWFEEGES